MLMIRIFSVFPSTPGSRQQIPRTIMSRNTVRRVEVAAPVYDVKLQEKLQEMFDIMLSDNQKARQLGPDGNYQRVINEKAPVNSQEYFYAEAYHEIQKSSMDPEGLRQ